MKNIDVFYNYDEEHCFLSIRYDEQENAVVIRGGYHSFARLAELFAIYSATDSVPNTDEHDHWNQLCDNAQQFIINLRPLLEHVHQSD